MAWPRRSGSDSSKGSEARDGELFTRRLSEVRQSSKDVEDADPAEVEARLRNITHGAGRD